MGVDLGTQSIKVIVYDPCQRALLGSTSQPLELMSSDLGSREQMAHCWLEGFRRCLDYFSPEVKASVHAIGVSGQQHGFVPLSASGDVLAPVKLWCDTSTLAECEEILAEVGGAQRYRELSGNNLAVGYTASKIRWLKNHRPQAYAQMTTIMLPHDYLNYYLTGRRAMECGDASGTGLFDTRIRAWSKELVASLDAERDLLSCFPALVGPDQAVGTIRPILADELGLRHDVVVSAGGGDNMMAAIGTGNLRDGKLTASLGTSGTLFAYSSRPVVDERGELAAFCSSSGGWLPLVCTMNCTVATEQLRKLFDLRLEQVDALASAVSAGSDGLLTLPFYSGERTPDLPNGKAVIFGLDLDNSSQSHLLRSAMEASVLSLKTGLAAFTRNGLTFDEVILTGGGSHSRLWCQICADIFNLPANVLQINENAAFGAVLQALWCYRRTKGMDSDLVKLAEEHLGIDKQKTFLPNRNHVATYTQVYDRYDTLLKTLSPLFK